LRGRGWAGPAILATAYATRELRQAATDAGFSALLEKPFKEHALVNAISRLTGEGARACG